MPDNTNKAFLLCSQALESGSYPFEQLIFPEENHKFFNVSIIDMDHIQKAREEKIQRDFEATRLAWGDKAAEELRKKAFSEPLQAFFTII